MLYVLYVHVVCACACESVYVHACVYVRSCVHTHIATHTRTYVHSSITYIQVILLL